MPPTVYESPSPPAESVPVPEDLAQQPAPEELAQQPAAEGEIEVDENDYNGDDRDSTLDEDSATNLTSLSSSVTNYVYENGRRYHAYKEGRYLLPNDDEEMDREDMKNHWSLLMTDGRLHLAPLGKSPQKILDVGTGTGAWPMQMADKYPSAEVIGVDLSPIQPKWVPPNLSFEVDDAEASWTYPPNSFDYIHIRFMSYAIRNWPKLFRQAYRALRPGGWIECVDLDNPLQSDDNSIPTPSHVAQFFVYINKAANNVGLNTHCCQIWDSLAKEAGFENATTEVLKLPMGTWPKDRRLKEAGAFELLTLRDGLSGIALGFFTRALGMSATQAEIILVDVRKELSDKKIHAWFPLHHFYAQKPMIDGPAQD